MIVKDSEGHVVGPNEVMHWRKREQMLPIDSDLKNILDTKHKAVAWLVSNCNSMSKREKFVQNLEREMAVHELLLDTFGKCGKYTCGSKRLLLPDCWEVIQSDYYFYLSFENSFSKDYVTEKLLRPLQHYTVPIVYGSANYTRYMPDGAYLNAFELGAKKLAAEMKSIIDNKERYYNFFKWRNHYSYHDISEDSATDNYCRLCAALHANDTRAKTEDIPFTDWWNSPFKCSKL
ncbi:alpha-(1,3)-fucosyltransferase C-like [Pectinophora gossypiella]|uniref:alpha-(1,3)-fucosyltransferase C-like n=1 Tax=Pectinophora gossypiella TaxID=13191 RepID=UPI00214F5B72|nr:alpha-(1,3)-fucosyltransferase C-like [Pectinophora gossypiella]